MKTKELTPEQYDRFWRQGYLVVENAVTSELLDAMKQTFERWVNESAEHDQPYGQTINNHPRFDLEPSHRSDKPALRRVNAPIEISQVFYEAMSASRMTDLVMDLLGPNVKFHHSKINSKLPGGDTAVKWHQDFTFTPHTNEDVLTALLMMDEVSEENGPLEVLPGSHLGPLHSLWHNGVFTGAVDDGIANKAASSSELCLGPPGAVCLMHSRLLHASKANKSVNPRTLFISVYSACDAIPCSPNPMPNKYEGIIVRGKATNCVRTTSYEMELPQLPTTASFFDQQAKHS